MSAVELAAILWFEARIACAACESYDIRKDENFKIALAELANAEDNLALEVKKIYE